MPLPESLSSVQVAADSHKAMDTAFEASGLGKNFAVLTTRIGNLTTVRSDENGTRVRIGNSAWKKL